MPNSHSYTHVIRHFLCRSFRPPFIRFQRAIKSATSQSRSVTVAEIQSSPLPKGTIGFEGADDVYREIRVEHVDLEVSPRPGVDVQVTVEAETGDTAPEGPMKVFILRSQFSLTINIHQSVVGHDAGHTRRPRVQFALLSRVRATSRTRDSPDLFDCQIIARLPKFPNPIKFVG
jgi:hypothetical protein